MESTQLVIREEKSQFQDYIDLKIILGKGAQGEVIKVRSKVDGIEYAMKVINAVSMKNEWIANHIT